MRLIFALLTASFIGFFATFQAAEASDAILLDFSSAHCSPCQAMKPTLAQLASNGVAIRHVDVVSEPHLAARYGIRKTPTYVVVSGGKEVARLVGQQTMVALQEALVSNPIGASGSHTSNRSLVSKYCGSRNSACSDGGWNARRECQSKRCY